MPSLLAIAIVRRLLLELKVPEGEDRFRLFDEPIETWVSRIVEDFGGWTPAQALAAPRGDEVVRAWLERRLGDERAHSAL